MTQEQKANIAADFKIMAEVYGKTFSAPAIVMLVEALNDLDFVAVKQTLNRWTATEKFFPMPADIRAKVMPEIDDKDDGIEVSNSIIKCVGKYGYTNPDAAKERMGELAWEVVNRMGGWKHICETLNFQNETTFRAQIRDYAQSVAKRAKRGELNEPPALPRPTAVSGLISDTIKKIGITT